MTTLGRYELLRPLARGGMAEVYLARRRVAGVEKRLVIKRLRRDRSRDPRFLELFIREAQLSMSLVQQNIVPVFDFGRIGDDVFLAMEHIDGKDLGSSIARQRGVGMPPLLAAFVAAECGQALDHAHRRPDPVIHRDVTPRNVLLSWDGEVKLADFGIAAVVGDAAGSLGTPGYMAPEQARGEPPDLRVDVYALGIVLWEALIGDHVRPAAERAATLAAARSGELPPLDPRIPEELVAIIRRATAIDPADRYASARDMADALDTFLVAERARDAGPAPAQRLAEWLRSRWGEDRDEAASTEMPAGAGMVVSFLDDGAAGVRGTGTQRSLMETAADDQLKTPPPHQIIHDEPADHEPARVEPAPEIAPPPPRPATTTGKLPPRRRWVLPLAALLIFAAGGAAVAWWQMAIGNGGPHDAAVALPPDALEVVAVDAAAPALDAAPPDAADAREPDAALVDAGRPVRVPDANGRITTPRPDAAPAVPAGELRPITIGATPWAFFTVDGDPKQYETPMTLRLSVGDHRITFTNPELGVSRTVTVTVPADGDARHVEKMN